VHIHVFFQLPRASAPEAVEQAAAAGVLPYHLRKFLLQHICTQAGIPESYCTHGGIIDTAPVCWHDTQKGHMIAAIGSRKQGKGLQELRAVSSRRAALA
jgi:hypothetical protein